jgi:ABC-type antimicrobial peptide transport system permease subunit
MKPVLIGSGIGAVLAARSSQLIRSMLYGISPLDAIGFGGAVALLTGIAIIAALVPATAALRLDPSETLRHD